MLEISKVQDDARTYRFYENLVEESARHASGHHLKKSARSALFSLFFFIILFYVQKECLVTFIDFVVICQCHYVIVAD
jgi:hypothetical protein